MPEGLFVARSSEVLPLVGEYERGIATWINARIGPIVARYIGRLADGLPGARVSVMQSSGEAVTASQAARHTARLLLSGPAGGLAGAAFAAAHTGCPRLLTFDMGGTSTDVAVVDGEPRLTTDGRIAGFPVALPMVDMHTIGAGGGSIARLDAGGMLLVGPESAGADPGPACYDRGGREATVTDANLVLGRLDPNGFLGGRMRLNPDAARAAIARLARRHGALDRGGGAGRDPSGRRAYGPRPAGDLGAARPGSARLHPDLVRRCRRSACLRLGRCAGHHPRLGAGACRCPLGARDGGDTGRANPDPDATRTARRGRRCRDRGGACRARRVRDRRAGAGRFGPRTTCVSSARSIYAIAASRIRSTCPGMASRTPSPRFTRSTGIATATDSICRSSW